MSDQAQLILLAVVTFVVSVLGSAGIAIRGRAEISKDAEKVDLERERQRIAGEQAFQAAFADIKRDFDEERRKNERLNKRVDDLVDARSKDAGELATLKHRLDERDSEITTLTQRLTERDARIGVLEQAQTSMKQELNALRDQAQQAIKTLAERTKERDDALALVLKQNGEIKHRDAQIAQLTTNLKDAQAQIDAMQERLLKLENGTGKLNPAKASEGGLSQSKAQIAVDAMTAAQEETTESQE